MKGWYLSTLAVVIALAIALTGAACGSDVSETTETPGVSQSAYVTVDVNQAYAAITSSTEAQIVDVREPDEWAATGVPPGAILIPLGDLEAQAPDQLAKDKPVYVICNSGNRSRTGSQILVDLGYAEVFNVDGGIQAWLAAGLPVETYTP